MLPLTRLHRSRNEWQVQVPLDYHSALCLRHERQVREPRLSALELATANPEAARRAADEVVRIACRLDTGRANRNAVLAMAIAYRERDSAADAVHIARQQRQPFELAGTLAQVAMHGLAPKKLGEAYDVYGELGAPPHRAPHPSRTNQRE